MSRNFFVFELVDVRLNKLMNSEDIPLLALVLSVNHSISIDN
jgi:hypothetical protein